MVRIQAGKIQTVTKIDPSKRCYEGASAQGQLQFVNEANGWTIRAAPSAFLMGPAMTLALGLTECCARFGRGKVFWFVKGNTSGRQVNFPWTVATIRIPSLLYVDFVWNDTARDQWFNMPHWARLDALSARGHALDLAILTMPITLTYELDNYSNVRANEGLAPITLIHNSSGYTYLGFTADMSQYMLHRGNTQNGFWQAEKPAVAQFKMFSGLQVVTQLRSMYREARLETFMFLRTVIREAVIGHDEWVGNGGYTIEGDPYLGPTLARQFRAAIQAQGVGVQAQGVGAQAQGAGVQAQGQSGNRLGELRNLTHAWSLHKRASLQDFIDVMNTNVGIDIVRFTTFDMGWSRLSLEEKGLALELYELEDENDRRNSESDEET